MNLKFWKKKTTPEDGVDGVQDEPGDQSASRKSPGREPRRRETSGDTDGNAAVVSPAHPDRRLIAGAAIGVLISAAVGMASWKIFLPSPGQDTIAADIPASIRPSAFPERKLKILRPLEFFQLRRAQSKDRQAGIEALRKQSNELPPTEVRDIEPSAVENPLSASRQAEIENLTEKNDELQTQIGALRTELSRDENPLSVNRQAEIEILRKKNDELQTEIAALRKKQQPNPSAAPANQAAGEAQAPARGGDIAMGNRNPKAAAMTLKEAIEVMNASSGDSPGKVTR